MSYPSDLSNGFRHAGIYVSKKFLVAPSPAIYQLSGRGHLET
jgi:hypothetical protein